MVFFALGGVVHDEFAIVVHHLGCPEFTLSPAVYGPEGQLGLTPVGQILAGPHIKSFRIAALIGGIAIVGFLVQQNLRIPNICHIGYEHIKDPPYQNRHPAKSADRFRRRQYPDSPWE